MTDLERLWDDLPVGPVPTERILRQGRAGSRRAHRRTLLRSAGSLAVLGSLAAAFVAGAQIAGPASPHGGDASQEAAGGAGGAQDAQPAAFHGELVAAGSCDALLAHYVDRAEGMVGPWGWERWSSPGGPPVLLRDVENLGAPRTTAGAGMPMESSPVVRRATSSDTGTNVQEAGVDEPDVVKTDGETLYRLEDETLTAYDVTRSEVEPLGELRLEGADGGELLLVGDTVVVVGAPGEHSQDGWSDRPHDTTRVYAVDVADPATMTVPTQLDLDASTVAARQHGDTVRLVLSTRLPDLPFVRPGRRSGLSSREALEQNRDVVRSSTIGDWLPSGSVDGEQAQQLSDCADVAVPRDQLPIGTTTVLGFPAGDPAAWDVTAVAADATTTYASAHHLYLATSPSTGWGWVGNCLDRCLAADPVATSGETHVFDFELSGSGTRYAGAGEGDGAVEDRWAIDESDGVLRLAVSPTSETGGYNSVVTLRLEGDELVELGRLDRLGVGEDIRSVRWFDDLAIVVTFRQVDPLYTVDLSDPSRPVLLGTLKIPGFSDYLHPLGQHRLIGIGQGPTGRGWGAQSGLFRVTDLTDPSRLSVVDYPAGSRALAGGDPRQFTWLPDRRTALTVVAGGGRAATGWVSVLTVADGALSNRMLEVEHGDDVAAVRLVPLPDERVVLVTDNDVRYLPLQ